jgi:hypothetical protein
MSMHERRDRRRQARGIGQHQRFERLAEGNWHILAADANDRRIERSRAIGLVGHIREELRLLVAREIKTRVEEEVSSHLR